MERPDISRFPDTPQPGQPMPRLRRELQWSPIAATLCLCAAVVVNACSSGNNPSPSPYPGRLYPIAGQWVAYGTSTGLVTQLSNPFAIPTQASGKSLNYVYTQSPLLAAGKTVTLIYNFEDDGVLGVADSSDIPPVTIRLFIWGQNADDTNDRWWCPTPVYLAVGRQPTSCVISGEWTGVFDQKGSSTPQFNASLANPFAVGFTFGGQYFAGHGVWLKSGSATFTVLGYTVQ